MIISFAIIVRRAISNNHPYSPIRLSKKPSTFSLSIWPGDKFVRLVAKFTASGTISEISFITFFYILHFFECKMIVMPKVKSTGDFESLEVTDGRVKIHQRDPIKPKDNFYIEELPWTEKQKRFIEISQDKGTRLILCKGPAGSSKTLTAVYSALNLLNTSKVSDVIYMRSAVESSDSRLGFLPGDADEKLHYYNLPFMDKLDELLSEETVKKLQKEKRVSIHPVNFARGMSWNGKAILMDEAQNSSFREIVTVLTRIGKYSRCIIMADPMQTDLKNGNRGGFVKLYDVFNNQESRDMGIHTFEFSEEDIVRSELTKFIVSKLAECDTI